MRNSFGYITAGELAKIHGLNKRTLHFYDERGLFCPKYRGENGYRYYGFEQSLELEHILALRELGLSIEEIKGHMAHPNAAAFCSMAEGKMEEIDKSIHRLKQLRAALGERREMLMECSRSRHGMISLVERPRQFLLMTPLPLRLDTPQALAKQSAAILEHLKQAWALSSHRKGCGSYISLQKVEKGDWECYDGIFSQVDTKGKGLYARPKGTYLQGFCLGDWEELPKIYVELLDYARQHNLRLCGYAFERGLNEFALANEEEYVTQIEIRCEEG